MGEKKSNVFKTVLIFVILAVALTMVIVNYVQNNRTVNYEYKRKFGNFEFESTISGNLWKNTISEIKNTTSFPFKEKVDEDGKKRIIEKQEEMDKDIRAIKGADYSIEFLPGKIKKTFIIPLDSQENIKKAVELGILDADENAKSINLKKTIKAMDESDEWQRVKN